mmetsp:Transcript_17897/g.39022  ORF Transcript_17897/g.39022 Transcript_17897/m.39022 type:complete len:392 (+) Transcript_17897:181-1356(+)
MMHSTAAKPRQIGQQIYKKGTWRWAVIPVVLVFNAAWNWSASMELTALIGNTERGADKSKQEIQQHQSPIHVLFGLSGNHPGFLSEFEVALKSVLLNSPMERELGVHILADEDAYQSMDEIFNQAKLSTWVTRNPINIHAYDVTSYLPSLEHQIKDTFARHIPDFEVWHATSRHTLGTFFRLIAHHFIPPTVKHILYIDTDVVIMANLEELWQHIVTRPDALFHWGAAMCAGFVVMNVPCMDKIWALAKESPMKNISDNYNQGADDQLIYMSINVTYPDEVNVLPDGWDMTVTNRWQSNHKPYEEKYPNVGMLHINGGGESKSAYFNRSSFLESFPDTWGNAYHYVRTPWPWARYQAKSLLHPGSEGHLIHICFWGQNKTLSNSSSAGCRS